MTVFNQSERLFTLARAYPIPPQKFKCRSMAVAS